MKYISFFSYIDADNGKKKIDLHLQKQAFD